jgi:hypothetical protein
VVLLEELLPPPEPVEAPLEAPPVSVGADTEPILVFGMHPKEPEERTMITRLTYRFQFI